MNTRKQNRFLCVVLTMVLTAVSLWNGEGFHTAYAQEAAEKITVYVAAEGKNASGAAVQVKKTPVRVEKGATAAQAIRQVLDQSAYKDNYTISTTSWGESLDAINGLDTYSQGQEWFYWSFCVNGNYASEGIGQYKLQDNDKISLIYSYENYSVEAGDFVDDATKNPTGSAIVEKKEQAGKQQDVLAKTIYDKQFLDGHIPGIEDTNGLYSVFSLARAGADYTELYNGVVKKLGKQLGELAKNGKTTDDKGNVITEESILKGGYAAQTYGKIALAVTALGKDASDVNGFNLIEKLVSRSVYEASSIYSRESMILFAIDSKKYELPKGDAYLTREELVEKAAADVENQIDTSINWNSVDSAAMAIQPLAPYAATDGAVKATCEKAIRFLESMQGSNGFFGDEAMPNNPWTLAQVMITAGAFEKHILDEEDGSDWIKNGVTFVDCVEEHVNTSGEGKVTDTLLSFQPEQLLRGINSCIRATEGKATIFDMTADALTSNVEYEKVEEKTEPATEKLTVKNKREVVAAGKTKKVAFTVTAAQGASQTEPVSVTSKNKKVATAKIKNGKVEISVPKNAVKGKSTTITLTSGKKKATIQVFVKNAVTSLKAEQNTVTLKKGKTTKVTVIVKSNNKNYNTTDTVIVKSKKGNVENTKTVTQKKKVIVTVKGKKKGKDTLTIKIGTKSVKVNVNIK